MRLEEAWDVIAGAFAPIDGVEELDIFQSIGRVLAADLHSEADIPAYRHAAMDGFCVPPIPFPSGQPWRLPLIGRTDPGDMPPADGMSGAIAVATGSPVPADAYAVVRKENATASGAEVVGSAWPKHGTDIRQQGEDLPRGAVALRQGTRLDAQHIALAAAAGAVTLTLRRVLTATILSTGAELVQPGTPLAPGKVIDSNGIMAAAVLKRLGCAPSSMAQCSTPSALANALAAAAEQSDVIVVSGGMSVGELDSTRAGVVEAGGEWLALPTRLRPGKPTRIGTIGGCAVIGLPGNPFAAFVGMKALGEPVIKRLLGRQKIAPSRAMVCASFNYTKRSQGDEFIPVGVIHTEGGRAFAHRLAAGGSARLVPVALADGLARFHRQDHEIAEGAMIELWPLSD